MFPWKYFFDGKDQENTKTRGGKGQIRKIQKKQEGKNGGKKKKRFFTYVEVPILLLCSPLVGNVLSLPQESPLCDPPSGELPTRMGTSPTTKLGSIPKIFLVSCLTSSQIWHIL